MASYWTNPPKPFLEGWQYEPVPGWGANPRVAGPGRLGVGAMAPIRAEALPALRRYETYGAGAAGKSNTMLYVGVGALVLAAGAAVAYNLGYLDPLLAKLK